MIAVVWLVLAAWLCGGWYAANRILAHDDMPLTMSRSAFSLPRLRLRSRGCSALHSAAEYVTAVLRSRSGFAGAHRA